MVMRDQRLALFAYDTVARVPEDNRDDYKIAVNDLGANILRSGLVAAIAVIERHKERSFRLLDHLAAAEAIGLKGLTGEQFPARVRNLDTDTYILATREILQVVMWLKRAIQATFGD